MSDRERNLEQAASKVRLVVTDVDGVHTSDHVTIFGRPENEQGLLFGLEVAGTVKRLVPCDADGAVEEMHYLASAADGRIEGYRFYTRDGIAVKECLRHDIPVVFMTGRSSPAVRQRAKDLGVDLRFGVADKVAEVEGLLALHGAGWDEVFFMGNDIQDLALLRRVGFSAAPADAAPEVLKEVMFVSTRNGGNGAVREAIELVLGAKGFWQQIVDRARTLG
jgi:3-deoxy-D-manno-octulosonate 8-phosphate phosphatase (KDO 8-P phosphatase)